VSDSARPIPQNESAQGNRRPRRPDHIPDRERIRIERNVGEYPWEVLDRLLVELVAFAWPVIRWPVRIFLFWCVIKFLVWLATKF